jgi:hypothetical protein
MVDWWMFLPAVRLQILGKCSVRFCTSPHLRNSPQRSYTVIQMLRYRRSRGLSIQVTLAVSCQCVGSLQQGCLEALKAAQRRYTFSTRPSREHTRIGTTWPGYEEQSYVAAALFPSLLVGLQRARWLERRRPDHVSLNGLPHRSLRYPRPQPHHALRDTIIVTLPSHMAASMSCRPASGSAETARATLGRATKPLTLHVCCTLLEAAPGT